METIQLATRKELLALWYAWQMPDLERHVGTLERSDNPLVHQVYEAIAGGNKTLAAMAIRPCLERDLLDQVYSYEPPRGLLAQMEARRGEAPAVASLAGALWPDRTPIMVGCVAHFGGVYPEPGHGRTCETRSVTTYGGGYVLGVKPVTFSLWRGYTMQSGRLLAPCEHCRHERIMTFCRRIERAAEIYPADNLMRWAEFSEAEGRKIEERLRKRNQRADSRITFFTTFPLGHGRTILLHDAADVDGRPLPIERGELYGLVATWVLSTPLGKRAGHGLGTFGLMPKKRPGVEGEAETAEAETAVRAEPAEAERPGRIITASFGKLAMVLGGYIGADIPAKGADLSPYKISVADFIKLLTDAGVDYAVDGLLPPGVPVSRCKKQDPSTKQDKLPPDPGQAGTWETPDDEIEAIMPPKPIYLPGKGWTE